MERYDVAIIGAGLSGLAAGIRLAHFGKKVCIFERHYAPGGLNSFYAQDGRKFDVGLHAMTNWVKPGVKGGPLNKILRQLRISRDALALCSQKRSRVAFDGVDLAFTNEFEYFESEVARAFPKQIDGFRSLTSAVESYDDTDISRPWMSSREVVQSYISDPVLEDMLFCPLMYYGSATSHDMDFYQFVVMFKSIFQEGFARPFEGIRRLIRLLLDRYRQCGGVRKMKCGVASVQMADDCAHRLVLDNGEEVEVGCVLSSIGLEETKALCGVADEAMNKAVERRLSFVETMSIFDKQPEEIGWGEDTIVFFNYGERFEFCEPAEAVDVRSGVICMPNNFQFGDEQLPEGIVRVTSLANYDVWSSYSPDDYSKEKAHWFAEMNKAALRFMPRPLENPIDIQIASDMFTPKTVERYTWHRKGAIYGSIEKARDGRLGFENVFLCGTDQGYLGIIGSMLSGISMANMHCMK